MEQKIELDKVQEDEGRGVSYAKRRSKKRRKKKKILKKILLFFLILIIILAGGCVYLFFSGKAKLKEKGDASRPELKPVNTKDVKIDTEILDEDTLKYNGVKYKYNDEMMNFLFLGTDTSGAISEGEKEGEAGQADTIILAALDNRNKKITLIPVNRDTMTEISIYDIYGKFVRKQKEQLALAYSYGDGEKKSAELTEEAVSNLFYGLPIHGYFAINTSAIAILNDLVGGVEVTLLDDFSFVDPSYKQGTVVRLQGDFAETYLRGRTDVGDGTNVSRMERQQQYLAALTSQMLVAVRNDLTLPVSIYKTVTDYMVTDISADEVSYLATQAVTCSLNDNFIRNISGESAPGDVYMEFTADEKALYELILDIFYEKIED